MSRSRFTFAVCLLISAGVHLSLIYGLRRWYGPAYFNARRPEEVVEFVRPSVPRPPPPPPLGEAKSNGESINSSRQPDIQTAPKATEDQSALTRDPQGNGPSAMASAERAPKPLTDPVFAPPPEALPSFPKSPAPAPHKVAPPSKAPPGHEDKPAPQQQSPSPTPTPPAPPQPQQHPQQASQGGKPMEHSDRDSDLFAKQSAMEFRAGRVVARSGREVKFARPQENLAAAVDSAVIEFPAEIKMLVQIDATGHVRNVTITHGTGSASIDRIFELATYSSWFEPAKDSSGKPVGDEIEFAIVLN